MNTESPAFFANADTLHPFPFWQKTQRCVQHALAHLAQAEHQVHGNAVLIWIRTLGLLKTLGQMGLVAPIDFMQFGTLDMALLVSGASLFIHAIESKLLTHCAAPTGRCR